MLKQLFTSIALLTAFTLQPCAFAFDFEAHFSDAGGYATVGGYPGGYFPPPNPYAFYPPYPYGYDDPNNSAGAQEYYENGVWDRNGIFLPDTATSSIDLDIVDCSYCRNSGGQETSNDNFEQNSIYQSHQNTNKPLNVAPPPGMVTKGSGPGSYH